MINGKQAGTWNAHGIGTLSAHYDQKGKITTAGRDKTVKYWDGDGKALKTLGRFEEIAMETRLSHDGSRIIAGDWSGEISVWQTSDGKKIGSLGGNPPQLSARLTQAISQKNNHEKALGVARSKQAPLAQAEALAVKKETESAMKAKLADTTLASALTNLQKAQASLQQAQTEEKAKALDKTNKQKDQDAKTQALAQAKQNHLSHSNAHNDWKNRTNFRSEQVSALHEAHRKAEEAKERNKNDTAFRMPLPNKGSLDCDGKGFRPSEGFRKQAQRGNGQVCEARRIFDPKPDRGHSGPRHGKPSSGPGSGKVSGKRQVAQERDLSSRPSQDSQGSGSSFFGFEQESVGRSEGGTERPERRT